MAVTLSSIIQDFKEQNKRISEDSILDALLRMLLGLYYLQNNEIVHCGLKPQNILVDTDGHVQITDYATSLVFDKFKEYPFPAIGVYTYMSPEQLTSDKWTRNTDVWSLGCIVHEMCCLKVA